MRAGAARMNEAGFTRSAWAAAALRWLLQRPRDSIAAIVATAAAATILINALFMQSGPHPAPIFAPGHEFVGSIALVSFVEDIPAVPDPELIRHVVASADAVTAHLLQAGGAMPQGS